VAFGGSDGSGLADTLVADLGLTGIPFTNVKNGCATGGSALVSAVNAIRSGAAEVALAVGFDKHPRGAFDPRPEDWGLSSGYGEAGLMVTTQFFAIKIARYMREHGITEPTLAKVAAKAFRNGAISPNAWRREALTEEQVAAAPMVNDPLTQYMFCSPGEGGAAIIVASEAARFSEIFPKRGLAVDAGSSWILARLVGLHRAKELAFFGDIISAADSEALGLVNRVVPAAELDKFVDDWATRLAAGPPIALSLTKGMLNDAMHMTMAQALEAEARSQSVTLQSKDTVEAIAAFAEKRDPEFHGH
jgi:acetyl-CoA acetyltransferase